MENLGIITSNFFLNTGDFDRKLDNLWFYHLRGPTFSWGRDDIYLYKEVIIKYRYSWHHQTWAFSVGHGSNWTCKCCPEKVEGCCDIHLSLDLGSSHTVLQVLTVVFNNVIVCIICLMWKTICIFLYIHLLTILFSHLVVRQDSYGPCISQSCQMYTAHVNTTKVFFSFFPSVLPHIRVRLYVSSMN